MFNTILILGCDGMLGRYIYSYFKTINKYQVIGLNRANFDATQSGLIKSLQSLFDRHGVNNTFVVFNAIGLIKHCEQQYGKLSDNLYFRINAVFPNILSHICEQYGAKMIHPSTDCVFSGIRGLYHEDDSPDEKTVYGLSKFLGEPHNCTVIRTSIIGEEKKNYRSLIEWVRKNRGQTINGFVNHYWNGITCLEYAKLIHFMMDQNIFWTGIRHILSPEIVSKKQLVSYINDVYDLDILINDYQCSATINKSLTSKFPSIKEIPSILDQIKEQKNFILL